MDPNPIFSTLEQQYQLPQGYLSNTWGIESKNGTNMGSPNATYQGHFQLGPAVRQQYGVTDPTDLNQSATAAAALAADNAQRLRAALGRDPTGAELYLAHQQGATGAKSLLTNPDAPAGSVANPRFIAANGGDPSASASDFVRKWADKYSGSPTASGGTANTGLGAVGLLAGGGTDATPVASAQAAASPKGPLADEKDKKSPLDDIAKAFAPKQQQAQNEPDNSMQALSAFMAQHLAALQRMKRRG